jgi:hypothetical protein
MHKNGRVHRYLTRHNITLDCRIVDLDSVTFIIENEEAADNTAAQRTLLALAQYVLGKPLRPFQEELFKKEFQDNYKAARSGQSDKLTKA